MILVGELVSSSGEHCDASPESSLIPLFSSITNVKLVLPALDVWNFRLIEKISPLGKCGIMFIFAYDVSRNVQERRVKRHNQFSASAKRNKKFACKIVCFSLEKTNVAICAPPFGCRRKRRGGGEGGRIGRR